MSEGFPLDTFPSCFTALVDMYYDGKIDEPRYRLALLTLGSDSQTR